MQPKAARFRNRTVPPSVAFCAPATMSTLKYHILKTVDLWDFTSLLANNASNESGEGYGNSSEAQYTREFSPDAY